jgi:cyanophycinase
VIKEKYLKDKNFIVAGTSAGAMAIPKLMIYEGGKHEAMLKEDLKIASRLGILDLCIVDTHFIKRGRFGRLAHAVVMNPETLGIGLGEDTALIIKNGYDAECRGSGMVVIIDGNEILKTNVTEIEDNDPIFVKNLKVDLLIKGNKFSIKERKMIVE